MRQTKRHWKEIYGLHYLIYNKIFYPKSVVKEDDFYQELKELDQIDALQQKTQVKEKKSVFKRLFKRLF